MRLQQLPTVQRPRERLLNTGPSNLSDVELISVILGSGTRKLGVVELADRISSTYGNDLHRVTVKQLRDINIGPVQTSKLVAAIELGKRLATPPQARTIFHTTDVLREAEPIRTSHREYTIGLYLNARFELLKRITLTIGTLNANAVEARDVYAPALALPCRSLILIHNHPSGGVIPSDDDLAATQRLYQAGELLGVNLLDHVIVTSREYFSMKEAQLF